MQDKHQNQLFYQERLNIIIEYIHKHLDDKIELKTLATLSHFSTFHFHRISKALLGEPIGSYIARMRMESAAKMIRYTNDSIETIAYKVGFETPSALSKMFKKHFGISPSAFRKDKAFKFNNTLKMETQLNIKKPKIKVLENKKCLYLRLKGNYKTLDYGDAWKQLWAQVKTQKLFTKGIEHFGIPHDNPNITDEDKVQYDACLVIHKDAKPIGDIGVKTIEGGKFAVFLYQGSYRYFSEVYDYLFNKWLLNTEYELRDAPVMEKYISQPDRVVEDKLKTEFYIPIK